LTNESLFRSLSALATRECIALSEKSSDNKVYKIDDRISQYNLFLYLCTRFRKPLKLKYYNISNSISL